MKHIRKFFATFLALLMLVSLSTSAFAAEEPDSLANEPVPAVGQFFSTGDDGIAPLSGNILATGNDDFYGDGALDITMYSGKSWPYIQAGTSGSESNGRITVSVKFPDGNWYELGNIYASGDHTNPRRFSYCPAGTYHFLFESTTDDWIQVYAYIYD